MAGVAISLQRPTALILTVSPKTRFYQYMMRAVVATKSVGQILSSRNSIYPQKTYCLKGSAKTGHKTGKMFQM